MWEIGDKVTTSIGVAFYLGVVVEILHHEDLPVFIIHITHREDGPPVGTYDWKVARFGEELEV